VAEGDRVGIVGLEGRAGVGFGAREECDQGCDENGTEARRSKAWAREDHHAVRFPDAGLDALKLR
jgi:hypothetical protein